MLNARLLRGRQAVKRHDEYPGVLGNGSGNPYAGRSRYWVRFPGGTDASGTTILSAPRAVRYAGEGIFNARSGSEVLVRKDPYDGVETITRMVPDYADRANFDTKTMNPSDPVTKWWDVRNFIRLLNRPVGSGLSAATKVTTRENPFHTDAFLDFSSFTGTLPSAQQDLAGFIPAADEHCLVVTFFDFLTNTPFARASSAQALSSALDSTDYAECFAQVPHNEVLPLTAYELANAQGSISGQDVIEDLRTWLPSPKVYGFPNPIPSDKAILIRSTHQQIVHDIVVQGSIVVQGDLIIL